MALGPGFAIRIVWPSPFCRITSLVPMVPPPPERFSTTADWPQTDWRCAASRRPITSVEPPAAAGTTTRMVSVGRQSARLDRGRIVAAEKAAALVSTRRRDSNLLDISTPCFFVCRERRHDAAVRQADDLAQQTFAKAVQVGAARRL